MNQLERLLGLGLVLLALGGCASWERCAHKADHPTAREWAMASLDPFDRSLVLGMSLCEAIQALTPDRPIVPAAPTKPDEQAITPECPLGTQLESCRTPAEPVKE